MYNESPEMIKMLVRHGNSFALIRDKPVLELLNVDPARPVAVSTNDGKSLLVTPLSGAEGRTAKRTRPRQRPRRRAEKQGSI
jgi:antitoxin component of MazEF toxin-antitoxin module